MPREPVPVNNCLLHVETLAYGGEAVGHLDSGKVCFVPGLLPGEDAEIERDAILSIGKDGSPYVLHLLAKQYMKIGEYAEAHSCLKSILMCEQPIPSPMLYLVFADLEICCKEIEDFKGAYEYSIDKVELLQKLLS